MGRKKAVILKEVKPLVLILVCEATDTDIQIDKYLDK